MAKDVPGGWLCVANENWLSFLAELPGSSQVVYCTEPKRPPTRLPKGSPFICCQNDESPRKIHLVAHFEGFEVMSVTDAWDRYEVKLGLPNESDWLALRPSKDALVSCYLLTDVRFIDPPVSIAQAGVALSDAASNRGRYLTNIETENILSHLEMRFDRADWEETQGEKDEDSCAVMDLEEDYQEVLERLSLHKSKERNRKAVRLKKNAILKRGGKLLCEACTFDFYEVYGQLGYGFAECHHRIPLSQINSEHRIRLNELSIVCANCHRMLHVPPFLTVEELRLLIQSRRAIRIAT
jgi:hypothetical protein